MYAHSVGLSTGHSRGAQGYILGLLVIVEAATAAERGGEDWYRKEIRVPRKEKYREQPSARTDTTSLELVNLSKSDVESRVEY
jgi:hypothetical protein